jgi:hypothetical protein
MSDKNNKIEALIKRYGGDIAEVKPVETGRADALITRFMGKCAGKDLDLYVVFDTTGSMGKYIDAVRKDIDAVTSEILSKSNVRISVNGVGDHYDGDKMLQMHALTDKPHETKRSIESIAMTNGGDEAEAYECMAMELAKMLPSDSKDRNRAVVFVADALPHGMSADYGVHMRDDGCPAGIDYRQAFKSLQEQCDAFYFVGCNPRHYDIQQKLVDPEKGLFIKLDNMVGVLPDLLIAMTRKSQSEAAYQEYMNRLEAKNPEAAQKIYALLPGRK